MLSPRTEFSDRTELDQLPPAAKLLNRRLIGTAENGEVTIAFEAKPEFTNRHGTVQGGFLTAMLDSATAFTLLMDLPGDRTAVTTRLDTTFLKPAKPGEYLARSNIVERGERHSIVMAELSVLDDTVVARTRAELRILPRRSSGV